MMQVLDTDVTLFLGGLESPPQTNDNDIEHDRAEGPKAFGVTCILERI